MPLAPKMGNTGDVGLEMHFCVPAQVELLSWKSIKDLAGDGGIIKTVQVEGSGWQKPSDKDEARGAVLAPHNKLRTL